MDDSQRPRWASSFFPIWSGQALSLIGSRAGDFALVWWLTVRTGSATVLATTLMVNLLPGILLGPFVGALVDRCNRKRTMIVADTAIALFAAWLAYLFWAGAMRVWYVYAIMLLRALGNTFHWPAMQASTSLMVPRKHLPRVAGMNQALNGVLNVVSPPLGAFLIGTLPLHWVMALDVITALTAIGPLLFTRVPQPARKPLPPDEQRASVFLNDVREGFAYIWRWPGMRTVMLGAAVMNMLIYPGISFLPLLVTTHFGGGAMHLGGVNSAWGIGIILGGLALSVWGGFHRRIVTTACGLIGTGLGFAMMGLTPPTAFGLALMFAFLAGFMQPITNGPVLAILQTLVAPEMQGRVLTVVNCMAAMAAPVGLAFAGPVAGWLGIRTWFLIAGTGCVLLGVLVLSLPSVIRLENQLEYRPSYVLHEQDAAKTDQALGV